MNTSTIGRLFYGLSMAAMGILTIYYQDFPYMLLPPKHSWISSHLLWLDVSGGLLFLAGAFITLGKKWAPVSLLLGAVLLSIFCFCFIPYHLSLPAPFRHFGDWENAAKELSLAGGAFVMAGSRSGKAFRLGAVLFGVTILSFGIDHFLYAREAAGYIPSWIPYPIFWMYPTGAVLLLSGAAILMKIRVRLMATLLATMIFTWVIILHIPKAAGAPLAQNAGEVVSAFLALAYCGIAFAIAGDISTLKRITRLRSKRISR
ncbi:MAG TPA: hypothetical protein VGM89_09550 [Puia sp.]|jgi:hypothetical protein